MSYGNATTGTPPSAHGSASKPDGSNYMALYNASYHALKNVDKGLQIGGPAMPWLELGSGGTFLAGCKAWGVAADFISTHAYPTDHGGANMRRDCIDCFTDKIIASRNSVPDHPYLMTEYNCGWRDGMIHDGESKAYGASFAFRTVQQLAGHVQALSWWTFSSIFEEAGLPTDEFGPTCFEDGCVYKNGTGGVGTRTANAAMQSVHGVPFPVYRGFQLLAAAGSHRLPVVVNDGAANLSAVDGAVAVLATAGDLNESGAVLRVFLSNFVPDAAGPSSGCDDKPQLCPSHPGHTFCATNYSADQCEHSPAPCPPCPPPASAQQRVGSPPAKNWSLYNTSRTVALEVKGSGGSGAGQAVLRVINSSCSTAKAVWLKEMGGVTWPSAAQLDKLMEASEFCEDTVPIAWSSRGVAQLSVELEAYAAVSVTFTREPSAKTDDGLARPAMTVTIQNTEARRDVNGQYLDAHAGTIVHHEGTYYLYLLRQTFILTLPPFRLTGFFDGAGMVRPTATKRWRHRTPGTPGRASKCTPRRTSLTGPTAATRCRTCRTRCGSRTSSTTPQPSDSSCGSARAAGAPRPRPMGFTLPRANPSHHDSAPRLAPTEPGSS